MTYNIIEPPFTLQFRAMSRSQLADYRDWFLEVMPERIGILKNAVRGTPGFSDWIADFSPASLNALGEWFAQQVETRARTPDEIAETQSEQYNKLPIERLELTNRTYSLAMDIGMYLGQVMLNSFPGRLRWDQFLKNKRDASYGQVTINGTDVVSMNTVRLLIVLAWGGATKVGVVTGYASCMRFGRAPSLVCSSSLRRRSHNQ